MTVASCQNVHTPCKEMPPMCLNGSAKHSLCSGSLLRQVHEDNIEHEEGTSLELTFTVTSAITRVRWENFITYASEQVEQLSIVWPVLDRCGKREKIILINNCELLRNTAQFLST